MRNRLLMLLYLLPVLLQAQALRDINYNYLYDADGAFSFRMKPVRMTDGWHVFFALQTHDNRPEQLDKYTIEWEIRNDLKVKDGTPLYADSLAQPGTTRSAGKMTGEVFVQPRAAVFMLVAKVTDREAKRAWMFYETLYPAYPVNSYLENTQGDVAFDIYFNANAVLTLQNGAGAPWAVSHYVTDFPAAAPAFSETMAPVPSIMQIDSTFFIQPGQPNTYPASGLYLVQKDTSDTAGIAFSIYKDYPKYARLENLADPLVYVCTRQEFDRLKKAQGDKRPFDRVILGITKDAGRAKDFMRSYFQRVEHANRYFSSYKEGWKTDRGMIYIVFGLPDEVYKFDDREVWNYKNTSYKITFDFVRSGTLFDPDNHVLVRSRKYRETWYKVINLWRNARF